MSTSKGNKRISVFDRLGPGTDESSPSHRRHTSSSSGVQEKGRGHAYGSTVSHGHMEDRETPPSRDRKARHRTSMGDYPPAVTDVNALEDKRTPNPPPLKSTREAPEALKSMKTSKASGSGESDYESGEDGKRRKGYHGDQDMSRSTDGPEDGSGRRGKDKGHSHSERPGSSASHHRSPPPSDKQQRSRRDGGSMGHEHKRRKEEDVKTTPELGHKRKRDHFDDGHLHETKRARHGDHGGRDSEHQHGDHHHGSKESEHPYGSTDKKWRQESGGSELPSRKQQPAHHSSGVRSSGGERERERERSSSKAYRHSSRERESKRAAPAQEKEHVRVSEGRTSRSLDWGIVNSYTEKANSKLKYEYPVAVLKKFTPAAIFSGIAVPLSLAGPQRYQAILELVRSRVKESGEEGVPGCWLEALQLSREPSTLTAPRKTRLEWDKTISDSLGPCRRALTAADDYVLRRMLRKGQDGSFISPVRTAPNSWATSQYEIALNFYNTLATKPSGKPANRLQTSRVGTLVL